VRQTASFLIRLAAACAVLSPVSLASRPVIVATNTDIETCEDSDADEDDRVTACTAIIDDIKQPAEVRSNAYVNRGELFTENEEYAKAVADFTAALALTPADPATLTLRGNAYDGLGDGDRALADYTAAIELEPGDAAPYYNRGTIYHERGEREKAAADYRKALAIDPTFTAAQEALAELEQQR
jgi:tetratricopeptide (TPR) repeat protein